MFEIMKSLSPNYFNQIFNTANPRYNLRSNHINLSLDKRKTDQLPQEMFFL
jgi:hypothetical protein